MPSITPLNKALILINVVVFGLQYLLGGPGRCVFRLVAAAGGAASAIPKFHVWQLLTYGFMHGSAGRICSSICSRCTCSVRISNACSAPSAISFITSLCVIGAALMHLIVVIAADRPPSPMVGASGGVFGLLLAFGMAFPNAS